MSFIRTTLLKAAELSPSTWGAMTLLMLGAFIKSMALGLLDGGAVALYLGQNALTYMAFDFMGVALLMVLVGYYALLFGRRQGYGSVPVCAVAVLIFAGLLGLAWDSFGAASNLLFIFKYGAFILFNVSFWAVASRFISVRFDSRKCLVVACFELIGFGTGGLILWGGSFSLQTVLIGTLFLLIMFTLILKILVDLNPVPSETFVKKVGGAQEVTGQLLIRLIFALSFIYMFAKGLLDYSFYNTVLDQKNSLESLGILWTLFGFIGLLMLLVLSRTRFLYMPVLGMVVLVGGLMVAAGGIFMYAFSLVLAGLITFMLMSYFYLPAYFKALPRPLALGHDVRIKQERLLVLEPLGFLGAALVLFDIDGPLFRGTLLVLTALGLLGILVYSAKVYASILLDSLERRQWRGSPLIITFPKILQYILHHLKSDNPDETLYFLRILGLSKHPDYQKNLLRMLKHPSEIVRVYVLNRLDSLGLTANLYKTIETIFTKDSSAVVRQKAVSLLMQVDSENPRTGIQKYMPLLKDKKIEPGVLLGLLKLGGNSALLAMDGLQRLSFSKHPQHNIIALKIIEQAPLSGLVRLVEPLMKHPDIHVARQALSSAGAMRHPALLGAVFEALDDLQLQEAALKALECYGKRAFPLLEKMLQNPQTPPIRQKILILFLNASASGEGKQILIRTMSVDNQKLRKAVMSSLINSYIVWIHKSKTRFLKASLKKDIERFHFCQRFIELHTQAPTHETEEAFLFLRRALLEDMLDTRELILLQLHLLKNHSLMAKAVRILLSDRFDQYETALGVVQDFLPSALYHQIRFVALFQIDTKQRMPDRVVLEEHLMKALAELIVKPPFVLPVWVKSTALYCLRRLGDEDGKEAVLYALQETNPIVLEAAIWALVRLEKDKEKLHQTLLTLPTSLLVGQSLEQILES